MKFKAAIFDMDGTLLESMHVWQSLAADFLKKHRISPGDDFAIKTSVPSIRGAVEYMIDTFELPLDAETETAEIYDSMYDFYSSKVQLKPGAEKLLKTLRLSGIKCGLVTATEPGLAAAALKYTGLAEHFGTRILSGAEHNISKSTPLPFQMMCKTLQSSPPETIVFEDAFYAAKCASLAGHPVAAIYDDTEPEQEALAGIADWYCRNWENFPLEIFSCSGKNLT